ncbi:unknown protein [Desulfotalea psychrophila LSv54]|uniref:Uncharacterized protein n=1 Tax=Desulfotalea psychrophila (strain LSv54 / DSM 12343) TaxID=177439 RepID=Q6AR45_DESPS|nr:unknown protein [Desulfotalea psychrophila LSv54]
MVNSNQIIWMCRYRRGICFCPLQALFCFVGGASLPPGDISSRYFVLVDEPGKAKKKICLLWLRNLLAIKGAACLK